MPRGKFGITVKKPKKKKSGKKPGRPGGKYKFVEPLRGARRIAGY